jgi:MscS family membrane protein
VETVRNISSSMFLGNSILQYILFFGCILVGSLLGSAVYHIFKNMLLRDAKRSEDDLIIQLANIVKSPFIILIFTFGFIIGKQFLTLNKSASELFYNIYMVLIQIVIFVFLLRLIDLLILRYLKPLVEKTESDIDDHMLVIIQKGLKPS